MPTNNRYEMIVPLHRRRNVLAGEALDKKSGTKVFLKLKTATEEKVGQRLQREAEILESLAHPQIPKLVDAQTSGPAPYIVTELLPHNPYIRDRLYQRPSMLLAAQLCISILAPLQHLHDSGITHRDVKTGNMLMNYCKESALVDFELGVCKDEKTAERVHKNHSDTLPNITADGQVAGTPDYIAPEQALGMVVTPQTDIYAAGIVLYEMTFGRMPYYGNSGLEVAMKHIQEPLDYTDNSRRVPDSMLSIIDKATQKDPLDRYESASAMAEDLERCVTYGYFLGCVK